MERDIRKRKIEQKTKGGKYDKEGKEEKEKNGKNKRKKMIMR